MKIDAHKWIDTLRPRRHREYVSVAGARLMWAGICLMVGFISGAQFRHDRDRY